MRLLDKIEADTRVPNRILLKSINEAHRLIRRIEIKKRDGGVRYVYQPTRGLKIIQYWLIENVFSKLRVHPAALAYQRGISIRHNAEKHRYGRYFLKMDFVDFFPSIVFADLSPHLERWYAANTPGWTLDEDAVDLIRRACFGKDDRLVMGFPPSPVISNIVMFEFDHDLTLLFQSNKAAFGTCTYTRYADDVVISTDKAKICGDIYDEIARRIGRSLSPRLRINPKKTRYQSSTGGSAYVTGLRICADRHLTLHRKYKDHVRLMLALLGKGQLPPSEHPQLLGHLNYIRKSDPAFYTKLRMKYFQAIESLQAR